MLKRFLKNERGLTLIELLAVVVILGIIAAIAVPSIGGLIDNSKKDAHVANAQQMINAAKIAMTGDDTYRPTVDTNSRISLAQLQDQGYIETMKDPDNSNAAYKAGKVVISTPDGKTYTYAVYLESNKGRHIGTDSAPVAESALKRTAVSE